MWVIWTVRENEDIRGVKENEKKLAVLAAGICALSLFLTGCSGEISNDYVTITKYKGVEIDKVDADAVSDNDVEAQINSVLQSKSTTTEVTDRAAQTGDTVTIDYEGKKDGVALMVEQRQMHSLH